jgi:hypothetical protein
MQQKPLNIGYLVYPNMYVEFGDITFKNWVFGPIDLSMLPAPSPLAADINGVMVAALAFEAPAAGYGNYPYWTAEKGWIVTFTKAEARWPLGGHGTRNIKEILERRASHESP